MQEQIVFSQGGYPIGAREPDRSYWAVKLNTDKWRCEMDIVVDFQVGKRHLDWTLDIASTDDWAKIVELWMICPPTPISPAGNTARLPISPAGTAFQLKVGFVDSSIGESFQRQVAQMIGRVTNQETGDCEVFVFDYGLPGLVALWKTNVFNMGTWRPNIPGQPSIAPIGRLSFPVLGLHFGDKLKYEDDCGCGEK